MASSSALQFLQHSGRHGWPVGGHQSGAGGSIIHNVACSAAQQCRIAIRLYEAYRMQFEVANCFHKHRALCQFGAMLFSKQGRLPCCRLEMCIRSGSYNSINSNHSACARMALNTDSKQVQYHFSSRKHPKPQT